MVRSPLRLLRRQGSSAPPSPTAGSAWDLNGDATYDAHGTLNGDAGRGALATKIPALNGLLAAGGDGSGSGGPATAGDFVPEHAEATEQVVLLLRDPNAGFLSRLWRKAAVAASLYNITFAFNCFDVWEQVLGNLLLLGSLALLVFGVWREGGRMLHSGAALLQQWADSR